MEHSDVFLSYRRKDVDFVKKIDQALKATGREVWVDWEDIPPGVEGFGDEIQKGIEGANAFIAILSPAYLESSYCLMELREALRLKKRIIPVVLEKFEPMPAPEGIGHINWVYFTPHAGQENTFEESFPRVLQALETDYEHAREHTRGLLRAIEWDKNQRNHSYLLKGAEIDKAEQWQVAAAGKTPAPTELQSEYIFISRKVQRRRQQQFMGAIGILLVLAVVTAVFAAFQARAASISAAVSQSRALASAALQPGNEDIAVALALEATRGENISPEAFKALAKVVYSSAGIRYLRNPAKEEDYSQFFYPAVSSDGQYIVLKNRMYDLSTNKLVREFENTPGYVLTGLFMPDDKHVILAGDDDGFNDPSKNPVFMGLYDVNTGKLVQKYDTRIGIADIQLSGDAKTLIGYQPDNKVVFWDVESGKKLREISSEDEIKFSPDLRWAAKFHQIYETQLLQVIILDAKTMESHLILDVTTLRDESPYGTVFRFSPDSKKIAVGSAKLAIYSLDDGEVNTKFASVQPVRDLHFSADGKRLVASLLDHSIIVWERRTNRMSTVIAKQNNHHSSIIFADFAHSGEQVLSMDANGKVLEWDVFPGNMEKHFGRFSTNYDIRTDITSDGKLLIQQSFAENGQGYNILAIDAKTLEEKARYPFQGNENATILAYYLTQDLDKSIYVYRTFSTDGGKYNSTLNVARLTTGEILQAWTFDTNALADFLPNGREILLYYMDSNENKYLEARDILSGKTIRSYANAKANQGLSYSPNPDKTRILLSVSTFDDKGEALSDTSKLLDVTTGQTLFSVDENIFGSFTPEGSQIISPVGDTQGNIQKLIVYDAKTFAKLREVAINAPFVGFLSSGFKFPPDMKSVFAGIPSFVGGSGGGDLPSGISRSDPLSPTGVVRQWDFQTGELIWEYPAVATDIVLHPDGKHLITTDENDQRIWRLDTQKELIAWACANRYIADFTPEQRSRFGIESETSICVNR